MKALEAFDFRKAPRVPGTKIHGTAPGAATLPPRPLILIVGTETRKAHSLADLCMPYVGEIARALRHRRRTSQ